MKTEDSSVERSERSGHLGAWGPANSEHKVAPDSHPIWVFPKNRGFSPQIIHLNRVFTYKPSILGYPCFWKHPYMLV